jgi:hypothetical protein
VQNITRFSIAALDLGDRLGPERQPIEPTLHFRNVVDAEAMLASPSPPILITVRMRSAVGEVPAGAISSSVMLSRVKSTVSAPSFAPRHDGARPSSD